jgi:PAS domain-containing protein
MSNKEQNYTDAQNLRIKAEEKLKEIQSKLDKLVLESDAKKLMHELQVHQIELEMQNEELTRANEMAEAALRKYTMLYDFAPMGYFTLESDGTILDMNFTGAEILGDKRFSLIKSNFKLFVSEKSRHVFSEFLEKLYASNTKESSEVMLGYEDKPSRLVYMEGLVLSGDTNCLLSVVDITSFRVSE